VRDRVILRVTLSDMVTVSAADDATLYRLTQTLSRLECTEHINQLIKDSRKFTVNPLNAKLNPICHLLALLGAQHILHVSMIRVNRAQCELYWEAKTKMMEN